MVHFVCTNSAKSLLDVLVHFFQTLTSFVELSLTNCDLQFTDIIAVCKKYQIY